MKTHDETLTTDMDAASDAEPAADASKPKQRRGFAVMDKQAHREIARAGGVAAHAVGLAHRFTSELAREAGRKGGATTAADREHMRAIGRKGGLSKCAARRNRSDAK